MGYFGFNDNDDDNLYDAQNDIAPSRPRLDPALVKAHEERKQREYNARLDAEREVLKVFNDAMTEGGVSGFKAHAGVTLCTREGEMVGRIESVTVYVRFEGTACNCSAPYRMTWTEGEGKGTWICSWCARRIKETTKAATKAARVKTAAMLAAR